MVLRVDDRRAVSLPNVKKSLAGLSGAYLARLKGEYPTIGIHEQTRKTVCKLAIYGLCS
jgi:hypothetical protein